MLLKSNAREIEQFNFLLNILCCNYYSSFALTCVYITSTERFDCHAKLIEHINLMAMQINRPFLTY